MLKSGEAVILERIRWGAGSTEWYYCQGETRLKEIESQLLPGSIVSFYFDGRIRYVSYSPQLLLEMERIITEKLAVVFGILQADGLHIEVEYIDNVKLLAGVTSTLDSTVRIFYGAFPARDDDGVNAVTVALPDEDGVVRGHPH